ncbi:MAG: hypothetical protein IPO15_15535 [Anaerolineae bacterium]|uniref:hypothetical protein n=1 Tax=Candidatus Amarolinea dominans TaxID=3140696 RepID=UPI003134C8E2|nr:hypothetical protein [Anaerolineae bacterium]
MKAQVPQPVTPYQPGDGSPVGPFLTHASEPETRTCVDLELLVFIHRFASDLLHFQLVDWFGQHPDQVISLALLAPAVRRPIETVRPVLGDLVLNGLLITSRVHGELVYQLRPDPQMQATVRRFSRR